MRSAPLALLAGLVVGVAAVAAGSAATPPTLQHVTLIGDSVAAAISDDSVALATLERGITADLEIAPCRRVDQDSCSYNGSQPPNVIQLVTSMGAKIGPNVVVAVGYNDFADAFAQNIQNALAALRAAGVSHVWWLTLREAHHPYIGMNDEIVAAAAQASPPMGVIDWNVYSRSHPDWFQADGVHLLPPGAEAMATLIHDTLIDDGVAPPPVTVTTRALPVAHRLRAYSANLVARGGLAPLRWSLLDSPPTGIQLLASGTVRGDVRAKPGRYLVDVRVRDAAGQSDTRALTIRVIR